MSKFNVAAIALGSLCLTVLCAVVNVGQCAAIFGFIALAFGLLYLAKVERDKRLPEATLASHAAQLSNQQYYQQLPSSQSTASAQMLVPPPLDN